MNTMNSTPLPRGATFPSLDMTGWSICDFELAMDGLRQINDAVLGLQNQPRALDRNESYHPGAAFIVDISEKWLGYRIDELVARLLTTRFTDPSDEDCRQKLLIKYYADHGSAGETVAEIWDMVMAPSPSNGKGRSDAA